ncbi:hypothetical protein ABPG72_007585 [Tetrahymena utriculariae]
MKDQLLSLKLQNQTNISDKNHKSVKPNNDISDNKFIEQNIYLKQNDKSHQPNEIIINMSQQDEIKATLESNQKANSYQHQRNYNMNQFNNYNRIDTAASRNEKNQKQIIQDAVIQEGEDENIQIIKNKTYNENILNAINDRSLNQSILNNCEVSLTQDNICLIAVNHKDKQIDNTIQGSYEVKIQDQNNIQQILNQQNNKIPQNQNSILKDFNNQIDLKNCQNLNDVLKKAFNLKNIQKKMKIDNQYQNKITIQKNQNNQNSLSPQQIQKVQKLRSQSIFFNFQTQSAIRDNKINGKQDLDYQIKFQTLLSNIKVNQTNANEKMREKMKKKENLQSSEDLSHIFVLIDEKIYQIKLFKLSKKYSLSYEGDDMPSILFVIKEAAIQNSFVKDENSQKYQTQMLAQVSHELRTPLSCIMLMLEQLQQKISSELSKKFLRPSINSCNLLLSLINDILDLAQINAGKFTFIFQKFRLSKLLKETIKLLKQKAQLKGIDLILDYDKSIPRYIISDPNRLRQILVNLIGNSLKFTRKGHITLKTTLINTQPVRMDLQVIDTGIGIPKEKQEEIFNQFNKIQDNQNKQLNSNGCGLGLNISNQLAKGISINGQGIRVQSEVGHGSTFSFLLEDKQILQQTEHYIGYYKNDRSNSKQSKQLNKKDSQQRKRSKSRSMISQKQNYQNIQYQNGQITQNQNISIFCVQQDRNVAEPPYQPKRSQKYINNPGKVGQNLNGGLRKISCDLGVETITSIQCKKEENCHSSSSLKQISTSSKNVQEENCKNKNSSQNIKIDNDESLSSSSYSSSQSSSESQKSQNIVNDICRKSSRVSQIKSEQREKKCSIFDYMTNFSHNSIRFDQYSNLDKTMKTNSQQKLTTSMLETSNNNNSNNRKFSQLSAILQSQQQQSKTPIKKTQRDQNRFKTQIMISKLQQFDLKERNQIIVQELIDFQDLEQQCNQTNNSTILKKKNTVEDSKSQNTSIRDVLQYENKLVVEEEEEEAMDDIHQNLSETTQNSDIFQKDFVTQQSQQNFEMKSSYIKRSFSNDVSQIKSRSNKDMFSDYRKKIHISKKDAINMIKSFYENIQNTCDCFRILIVDDNQFNVQALKLFLSTYFYSSIDVAFDGEQAIEKVQNYLDLNSECGCREYDLIFMDIEMPLLDGFQTSIQIHKILSEKINNPKTVIIASSANDEYQESKLKKYKIDYQIEKPVKKKQLEQVLIKWANDIKFLIAITSSLRNIEFN